MRIRIVRNAGNYAEGAAFDLDDQPARELIGAGVAEAAGEILQEAPPERVKEVLKGKRRKEA